MFPKEGNKFPRRPRADKGSSAYARIVSAALRHSLDDSHRSIKTVMQWTHANERTAKNWLTGANGPNGDYLLVLLSKSDAVVDALIGTLSEDRLFDLALRLIRRRNTDHHLPSAMIGQSSSPPAAGSMSLAVLNSLGRSSLDPDDPNHDPGSDPNSLEGRADLNHRQLWFLRQLNSGRPMRAGDIRREHNVSEKTAKRDIAGLCRLNIIKYVGSRRRGRYMAMQVNAAGPGSITSHLRSTRWCRQFADIVGHSRSWGATRVVAWHGAFGVFLEILTARQSASP